MRYRFFTYNIDWAKDNRQETVSLRNIRDQFDVLCVQEAKHISVRVALGKSFYIHQNLRKMSKQGVAIAWRNLPTIKGDTGRGSRGYVVGVKPLGFRLLTRYINYRILEINGTRVLVISTHRPPQRYKLLWSIFDRNLIRFVKRFKIPVIVGMDSNEHTHALFAKESGMVWHGIGIDGFWLTKELEKHFVKGSLTRHEKADSDHHAVSIELEL